jgi:flavodoxin
VNVLVAVESLFGNTRKVADEIAAALRGSHEVRVTEAAGLTAMDLVDVDLMVIGGPTHAHGMIRPLTLKDLAKKFASAAVPARPMRSVLDALPAGDGRAVATFDTRLGGKPAWLTGSAARGIARRLAKAGYRVLATESFLVTGTEGPLADGELSRARNWATELGQKVPARTR